MVGVKILAIESSCDETAAAVVETCGAGVKVLSNIVASSVTMYQKYGGIIPEVAAREQLMSIIPVITEATRVHKDSIEAIAVSYGPGLMGSLLIGVETAKALSWVWKKPLLKVNHMTGHVLANWIVESNEEITPEFPVLGLVVSGGHTDIILLHDFDNWDWVGGTRDDAVGEAFDKTARILGYSYPGGPEIDKASQKVSESTWKNMAKDLKLPRPMINDESLDMSFSGIKAAVSRIVEKNPPFDQETKNILAREFSESIIEVLVTKTLRAIERFSPKSVVLAGGVAANSTLRQKLRNEVEKIEGVNFFVPQLKYCGDNAAMVAASALLRPDKTDLELKPDPGIATV